MLQGFAQLLIVQRVGKLPAPAFPCVERVYRLLPQRGGQVFERGWLFAAQEDGTVTVADDGVGVVFIDGLELALRLKNETDRDFPAADGSHQLFQLRYARCWRTRRSGTAHGPAISRRTHHPPFHKAG